MQFQMNFWSTFLSFSNCNNFISCCQAHVLSSPRLLHTLCTYLPSCCPLSPSLSLPATTVSSLLQFAVAAAAASLQCVCCCILFIVQCICMSHPRTPRPVCVCKCVFAFTPAPIYLLYVYLFTSYIYQEYMYIYAALNKLMLLPLLLQFFRHFLLGVGRFIDCLAEWGRGARGCPTAWQFQLCTHK